MSDNLIKYRCYGLLEDSYFLKIVNNPRHNIIYNCKPKPISIKSSSPLYNLSCQEPPKLHRQKKTVFRKLISKKYRGGKRFEENLKTNYGNSIIQDFNKLWKITNTSTLNTISEKYCLTNSWSGQIFKKLFRVTFNHLRRRQKDYYKKKFNTRYPCSYDVYSDKLTIDENCLKGRLGFLKVVCSYCGRYFYPSKYFIENRLRALDNVSTIESRLYCSISCIRACPKYRTTWKTKPKSFKLGTSREVQSELRQLVLERDDYECQKCGADIEETELHCHHIEGIEQNPIESADIDLCITLCKKCHSKIHSENGCSRYDLRKNIC